MREVRAHLEEAIRDAVARLAKAARVPAPAQVPWAVPPQAALGDLSTPLALSFASALGRKPREVAEAILGALTLDPNLIARAEVAGAGNHAGEWIISGPGRLGLPGREWVSRRRG